MTPRAGNPHTGTVSSEPTTGGGKRILLLAGGSPWPVTTGGYQRTNLLYRALAASGTVDTLIVSRHVLLSEETRERLRSDYGFVGIVRPLPPHRRGAWRALTRLFPAGALDVLAHGLRGWTEDYRPDPLVAARVRLQLAVNRYDLVVSRYMTPLIQAGVVPGVPTIVDVDDFGSEVLEQRLAQRDRSWTKRWSLRRRLAAARRSEAGLHTRCEHCWVTKELDLPRVGPMSASVLPNIPFPFGTGRFRFPRRDTGDGRTIVFVGSMAHGVNVSGVDAFVAECWPRIRAAVPDAVLRVYGTGLAEALRTRWESYEGVVVAGFVPDTRRVYGRAAFVVVPVFEGGGTKVKVLEALVHHRTCVAAEQALRGYEGVLRHGESVWVGSRHEDLVRGCVELLARPELRRRLAHKGCELVRRHYTFGRFAHVVGADVTRVLGAH